MYGYAGKVAYIDLTTGSIDSYEIEDRHKELFIGGKVLAAKIIYELLPDAIDPMSEDNLIVITTSPLTATSAPSSSRFNVSTISPLTKLLVSSNCGGSFGFNLKKAGYDGLIIKGKSPNKVYIDIKDEAITIEDATELWGKTTGETQLHIGGKGKGALVIGPAGENLVKYAAVISQERAIGRGGVGAVFGYKNLKGIVASGNVPFELFKKDKFTKFTKSWASKLKGHPLTGVQLPKLGSGGILSLMNYRNLLATKNYSKGSYGSFERINAETMTKEHLTGTKGCVSCPIRCARIVSSKGKNVKGPELETMTLLGSNLLNSNLQTIIDVNHLCDELGLDTISLGGTLGFAMELHEKGIWDNGISFGETDDLESLIHQIANREGIGDELAEGTRELSRRYGGEEYAINVKGLELAAYEPRSAQGMGLGYATSNRGGCHLNGGYSVILEGLGLSVSGTTTKGKAAYTVFLQDMMEAVAAGGTCFFSTYAMLPAFLINNPKGLLGRVINKILPSLGGLVGFIKKGGWFFGVNPSFMIPYPRAIYLATGIKLNLHKFILVGERGFNLERMINIRQGVTYKDDTLPKRLTEELQRKDEPDSKVNLSEMLPKYYKLRGWDEFGIPTEDRLFGIGLRGYWI